MENENMDEEIVKEILALPELLRSIPQLTLAKGIEYCGDAEDYIEALRIYHRSMEQKAQQLEQHMDALKSGQLDLETYTITVHSLKSNSLAIGAVTIFELAKSLEQAGKDGNLERIQSGTKEFLRMYRELQQDLDHLFEEISE